MFRLLNIIILLLLIYAVYYTECNDDDDAKSSDDKQQSSEEVEEIRWSCHSGWSPFAPAGVKDFSRCIKVFPTFRMTWQQAEESCNHFGDAHLISLRSADEIEWMNDVIKAESKVQIIQPWYKRVANNMYNLGWWIGLGQVCPNEKSDQMPTFRWTDGTINMERFPEAIGNVAVKMSSQIDWNGHNCITYHYDSRGSNSTQTIIQYFNISQCSNRRHFICQMNAFTQDRNKFGEVFEEIYENKNADGNDEVLSEQFPCGRDPFYCPLNTAEGLQCFHVLRKLSFWQQANDECNSRYQSNLASIHSKNEIEFIYNLAMMQPTVTGETKYWIGLHRRNLQSQYEWSDGTAFDFMAIRSTDDDEENANGACIAVKFNASTRSLLSTALHHRLGIPLPTESNSPAFSWIHQRCDNKHLAICQKLGYGANTLKIKSKKYDIRIQKKYWECRDDYKQFDGMCYKLYGSKLDGATFYDAIEKCKADNANLVSLTNPYEHGFVLSLLQSAKTDAWIGMDMKDGRVRWLDGEPMQMIRFSPDNRVIRIGGDKHVFQSHNRIGFSQDACVALDATNMFGYWNVIFNTTEFIDVPLSANSPRGTANKTSYNCGTTKLPYICESYAEESKESIVTKRLCDNVDDATYCILANDLNSNLNGYHTFTEASEICEALPRANEFYRNLSKDFAQIAQTDDLLQWSLLTAIAYESNVHDFFIGVRYGTKTGFERTDNVRLRLAPWGANEPNLSNGDCVAVKIEKNGPKWYMDNCGNKKQTICRLMKEKPMKEVKEPMRCPDGKEDWIQGKTQCYYLVTNTSLISSGYKADHDCFKYFNANLASFETFEDLELFKSYVIHQNLLVSSAIIGLLKQEGGSYAWKDGSPVTFMNWGVGEPLEAEKSRLTQECVQMELQGSYSWHTVSCWQSRHFICSVPLVDSLSQTKSIPGEQNVLPSLPPKDENSNEYDTSLTDNENRPSNKPANVALSKNKSEQSDGKSITGTVVSISAGLIVITVLILLYAWRRYNDPRNREQQIVQFDSLQNEEEYGM